MVKRIVLAAVLAIALVVTFTGGASAAPAQTATNPNACVQSLQVVGLSGWGINNEAGFGIDFSAQCPGRILVEFQAFNSNGQVAWTSINHSYVVSTTTFNSASATWVFGKTPPGVYNVYITLASQSGLVVYSYIQTGSVTAP